MSLTKLPSEPSQLLMNTSPLHPLVPSIQASLSPQFFYSVHNPRAIGYKCKKPIWGMKNINSIIIPKCTASRLGESPLILLIWQLVSSYILLQAFGDFWPLQHCVLPNAKDTCVPQCFISYQHILWIHAHMTFKPSIPLTWGERPNTTIFETTYFAWICIDVAVNMTDFENTSTWRHCGQQLPLPILSSMALGVPNVLSLPQALNKQCWQKIWPHASAIGLNGMSWWQEKTTKL